jgi:hypothetical protein
MHGEAPRGGQSLKLRWMKLERLSFPKPGKSTRHPARQLNMPHTTGYRTPWQRLNFKSYRYYLLQDEIVQGKEGRYKSYCDFLSGFTDKLFTAKIVFNYKVILNLSDNFSRQYENLGSNNPDENYHTRDSSKLNVFCALLKQKSSGLLLLSKALCLA